MYVFGITNSSLQRGLAPVFSSTYEHRSESSQLSIAPALAADHLFILDYPGARTNIYRQAGRTQARPKSHLDAILISSYDQLSPWYCQNHAETSQGRPRNLWEGTTNKKRCPTVKPALSSLICCLLNNTSQASCDFMVLQFPSNILVKILATAQKKMISKTASRTLQHLPNPHANSLAHLLKTWDFCCSPERGTALWGLHFQPSSPVLWHCTTQTWLCAEHSKFGNCHVQSVVKLLTEGLHWGGGKGWTSKGKPKWILKELLQ